MTRQHCLLRPEEGGPEISTRSQSQNSPRRNSLYNFQTQDTIPVGTIASGLAGQYSGGLSLITSSKGGGSNLTSGFLFLFQLHADNNSTAHSKSDYTTLKLQDLIHIKAIAGGLVSVCAPGCSLSQQMSRFWVISWNYFPVRLQNHRVNVKRERVYIGQTAHEVQTWKGPRIYEFVLPPRLNYICSWPSLASLSASILNLSPAVRREADVVGI